jgi:hypothetical protein
MQKICPICDNNFEGRRNKIYCSTRCRSEQGNASFNAHHEDEILTEKALRKNVTILTNMYKWFGNYKLPYFALENAGFDKKRNTGMTDDDTFLYHSYGVEIVGTEFFKIFKSDLL